MAEYCRLGMQWDCVKGEFEGRLGTAYTNPDSTPNFQMWRVAWIETTTYKAQSLSQGRH